MKATLDQLRLDGLVCARIENIFVAEVRHGNVTRQNAVVRNLYINKNTT